MSTFCDILFSNFKRKNFSIYSSYSCQEFYHIDALFFPFSVLNGKITFSDAECFFVENLHLKELVDLGSSKSKQLFSYCKHLFPRQNNAVCPLFGEATYENAKKDLI